MEIKLMRMTSHDITFARCLLWYGQDLDLGVGAITVVGMHRQTLPQLSENLKQTRILQRA